MKNTRSPQKRSSHRQPRATGKISSGTRDQFTGDIVKAIADIEVQRKELGERMQAKTATLETQLKTLEMLLATTKSNM